MCPPTFHKSRFVGRNLPHHRHSLWISFGIKNLRFLFTPSAELKKELSTEASLNKKQIPFACKASSDRGFFLCSHF